MQIAISGGTQSWLFNSYPVPIMMLNTSACFSIDVSGEYSPSYPSFTNNCPLCLVLPIQWIQEVLLLSADTFILRKSSQQCWATTTIIIIHANIVT